MLSNGSQNIEKNRSRIEVSLLSHFGRGVFERKETKMKVFGGNGKRENNSGRASGSDRADGTGRNYINDNNRGYNNPEPPRRRAPQPKKKGKAGKTVLIVLIVLAIIAACVFIYWKMTTKPPDTANIPSDPQATVKVTDTATREVGRYYTLLVVGIDQLQANTDTIMVVRYDAVENKANIVSIPRDTLVNVPNSVKKINAVFSYAKADDKSGIDALMDEVEGICGFRPDSYVFIDTNVFVQAIDQLGGVYYDVPVNMDYDDITPDINYEFHIHVQKGYQLLNGENALGVFRFRQNNNGTGYGMGDIDRLTTQHGLIKAVAEQALQLKNLTNLVSIAKLVSENCQTNLTYGNMQWYAAEFLKMSMDNINIMTLPGDYSCSIRGGSYVSINVDEWMTMVNTYINPLKNPIKAEDCNILHEISNTGAYEPDPNNLLVTDGSEIEGGIKSFYRFG